jgi:serine/threonine protein phosphatase PrpC
MWNYTSYLKKGLSHEKNGTECQDSVVVKEDDFCIVAALADGLGSLKFSDVAAVAATGAICELFFTFGDRVINLDSEEKKQGFAKLIVQKVSAKVHAAAEDLGVSPATMDCTLIFVYISKIHNYAITGRLGDSAICVIGNGESIAINDSSRSANGTSAILDGDACEHMEIDLWDLDAEEVCGFILTSDGLDNELYRKGSTTVSKAAEDYFNALVLSDMPQQVIRDRIADLTADADSPFDDDISIAVISRAETAITFPEDPTWLCTCGERNLLQDTYCHKCQKDFAALYANVDFKKYGGKTAFFLKINRNPDKERKLIGLPSAPEKKPAEKPAEAGTRTDTGITELFRPSAAPKIPEVRKPEPETAPPAPKATAPASPAEAPESTVRPGPVKEPASGRPTQGRTGTKPARQTAGIREVTEMQSRKCTGRHSLPGEIRIPLLAGAICLAIGLILGGVFARGRLGRDIRELSEKVDTLTSAVNALAEANAADSAVPPVNLPDSGDRISLPEDILADGDQVFYWGDQKNSVPDGQGIMLEGGYYYIGRFESGRKVGTFLAVPEYDPSRATVLTFIEGSLSLDELTFGSYTVTYSSLNLRSAAGLDGAVVAELKAEDVVYRTSTDSVTIDDSEWVEVVWNNRIGWVIADALDASVG